MAWISRWKHYLIQEERFPPTIWFCCFLLFLILYLSAFKIQPHFFWNPESLFEFFLGYFWMLGLVYHIRVFDDQKDRVADTIAYPERLLSRGEISYQELWLSGIVVIFLETLCALYFGQRVFFCHLATLFFSYLMLKEFFVSSWLKQHLLMYGILHNIFLGFMSFTLLQMFLASSTEDPFWNPTLWKLTFLVPLSVFPQEIARKIRLREEERPEIDTYSKVLGIRGALGLIHFLQFASVAYVFFFLKELEHPWWFFVLSLLAASGVVGISQARIKTMTALQARQLVGVCFLFSFVFAFTFVLHLWLVILLN